MKDKWIGGATGGFGIRVETANVVRPDRKAGGYYG